MGTNPFAINIPPASTQILPNDMVQLGQLLDMGQQRQLRALQVEQLRRQMADIESLRQQGGPFQSLQGLSGTVGQPQQPSVAIPPVTGSGAVPEGQVPSTSMVPGEPSSTAAPVPPPVQPDLSPSEQRRQAYESLMVKHPYAWQAYGKDMMELEKMHLVRQQSELEMHKSALGMLHQSASEVMEAPEAERPALWADRVNMFKAWGIPGMENVDPGYEPGRVRAFAAGARSASERVAQQQNGIKLQIESLDAMTKRHEAETKRLTEQREATRTEPYTSGQGLGVRPVFPGAPGAPPAQGLPAPSGSGVAMPPGTMETETAYDANGNIVQLRKQIPYGQTGQATRPQVVPPAFSAEPGQGGAAGTQLKTPQMQEKLMQPGLTTTTEQLSEARQNADVGRTALNALQELKQLAHQGYYDGIAAPKLASGDWPKLAQDLGVQDPGKLANTAAIQSLASRVVTAMQQGHFRAGSAEVQKLSQAAGGLEGLPKKQTLMELVDVLRRLNKQEIGHYNQLGERMPPASRPPHYGEAETPTISRADFEKRYRERQKVEPTLTRDDLALRYERGGYHVEGSD